MGRGSGSMLPCEQPATCVCVKSDLHHPGGLRWCLLSADKTIWLSKIIFYCVQLFYVIYKTKKFDSLLKNGNSVNTYLSLLEININFL